MTLTWRSGTGIEFHHWWRVCVMWQFFQQPPTNLPMMTVKQHKFGLVRAKDQPHHAVPINVENLKALQELNRLASQKMSSTDSSSGVDWSSKSGRHLIRVRGYCWPLNSVSRANDLYPIPLELIDLLGKAKYLTTLDLTRGYWQIPVAAKDQHKDCFCHTVGTVPIQEGHSFFGERQVPFSALLRGMENSNNAYDWWYHRFQLYVGGHRTSKKGWADTQTKDVSIWHETVQLPGIWSWWWSSLCKWSRP